MEFKLPAFLILAGPAASALEADLQASLSEHLPQEDLSGVMLWRVDPPETHAERTPERVSPASPDPVQSRDFQWKTLRTGNYFETAFYHDFGELLNRRNPNLGLLNNCYLCVVASGAQTGAETLAAIRDRTVEALERLNRSARTHLLWLIEDDELRQGGNRQMLADDLRGVKHCLAGFNRITALSAVQENGAHSLATRRQQLDALVPCMLETANAANLGGALVQTVSYRKLNCTRNEIRRLRAHRAAEALLGMQALPMDQEALWQCFSTEEAPLSRFAEQDGVTMAQSLMREIRLKLPGALELLVTDEAGGPENAAQLVADIRANNDAQLLEAMTGKDWQTDWETGIRERIRRTLPLRTVMEFAGPHGVLRKKLDAVAEAAEDQGHAHEEPLPEGDEGGWFQKPDRRYRAFERAARFYLEGLAYRALARRLRRMIRGLDNLLAYAQGLLAATERALAPYRLSEEEAALYHTFAEKYDEEITQVLFALKADVRAVFGGTREFYPDTEAGLVQKWQAVHEGLMRQLEQANAVVRAGFIEAYVLGKTTAALERDLGEKLSGAEWQIAGCNVRDTGLNVTCAGETLARLFPRNALLGGPLRTIPGDLAEHLRFGEVADTLQELATLHPFHSDVVWKPDTKAIRDLRKTGETRPPAETGNHPPQNRQETNPWHIRLERKAGDFMLYWTWPPGHDQPATIHMEHSDNIYTSLTCSLAQYMLSQGIVLQSDRLGVGRNRITIFHGGESSTIQAIGRRISVEYALTPQGRRKRVTVNGEQLELIAWTLSYRLDDPALNQELRLRIQTAYGLEVFHVLPQCEPAAEGLWKANFWTKADAVEFGCTPEARDILELIRVA
ncbi:MAG: hypothetical protein GX418_02930 [Clostridiales bacterium]|nr:hypothetical protein [Clostridiales bacterium]